MTQPVAVDVFGRKMAKPSPSVTVSAENPAKNGGERQLGSRGIRRSHLSELLVYLQIENTWARKGTIDLKRHLFHESCIWPHTRCIAFSRRAVLSHRLTRQSFWLHVSRAQRASNFVYASIAQQIRAHDKYELWSSGPIISVRFAINKGTTRSCFVTLTQYPMRSGIIHSLES